MKQRAIITGATGFAGRLLTAFLRGRGWEVTPCGYPPEPDALPCDVRDKDALRAVFDAAGEVSHVFHLAAIASVPQSIREPSLTFSVNVLGTLSLIEAIRERAPEARLLFVSTGEVYGHPRELPMTESHPLNPNNPYAVSKAAADQYCAFLSKTEALDIVRVRPFNHSGPGQTDAYVLSSFARQIACIEAGKTEPVMRVGNLEARRDFLHVDDVLRAYELTALRGKAGEAYNICSGKAVRIQDALDLLLDMAQVAIEVREDPERMRPSEVPEVRGSLEALHRQTGWQPEIPIETLLQVLLDDWRLRESA